jgi:uncharacterized protein (TIGR02118 family)
MTARDHRASGTTAADMFRAMPARILVLYKQPPDPAAFDKHYFETHVPIARGLPYMRSMRFSAGAPVAMAGTAPYLIAELEFDTMADLQTAMASPQGQATAADLQNFAQDPTLLIYETRLDG